MSIPKIHTLAVVLAVSLTPSKSFSAPRNWVQMSKNPQGAVYSDFGNIVRTGSTIRYWILLDSTTGAQPKSIVMRNEANCETMEWRRVYAATYDDQMGKGKENAAAFADAQWKPAIPEDAVVLAFPICDAFKQLDLESRQTPVK